MYVCVWERESCVCVCMCVTVLGCVCDRACVWVCVFSVLRCECMWRLYVSNDVCDIAKYFMCVSCNRLGSEVKNTPFWIILSGHDHTNLVQQSKVQIHFSLQMCRALQSIVIVCQRYQLVSLNCYLGEHHPHEVRQGLWNFNNKNLKHFFRNMCKTHTTQMAKTQYVTQNPNSAHEKTTEKNLSKQRLKQCTQPCRNIAKYVAYDKRTVEVCHMRQTDIFKHVTYDVP